MKKHFLILFIISIQTSQLFGQTKNDSIPFSKNSVYIEFLGNCLYGSINYDRIFYHKNINELSFHIGLYPYIRRSFATATTELSYLIGRKNHFSTALGISYMHGLYAEGPLIGNGEHEIIGGGYIVFIPRIGYRYQRPNGGVFFRIDVGISFKSLKLYNYYGSSMPLEAKQFNAGISIGYTFKRNKK
jgi:hypothetical protein